jgi:peroxiredoxin
MSIAIGADAPTFELPGVDGTNRTLDDYADAAVLVLIQSCNHCPYVQAWEGRMKSIQADYGDRGIRLVAISSNDADAYPEDSFDSMKQRAREQEFNFDYLYDESQEIARALGAERTPEVFVFGRDRRLVYHGAIDDSRDADTVKRNYLREAIEAALRGIDPPEAETPPVGCTVKYRK